MFHIMFDFHIYIHNDVYIYLYTRTYGFYYIRMFTFLKQTLAILSLTSVFAPFLSGLRGLPRVALLRPNLCLLLFKIFFVHPTAIQRVFFIEFLHGNLQKDGNFL